MTKAMIPFLFKLLWEFFKIWAKRQAETYESEERYRKAVTDFDGMMSQALTVMRLQGRADSDDAGQVDDQLDKQPPSS